MDKINQSRLLGNLSILAKIGRTPDNGVSRPAFSAADLAGRKWFEDYVSKAGFEYQIDGAANQSAILRSSNPSAKTLLIGSHLDSVPNGGQYDGSLGILVGLEVMETLKKRGEDLPFHIEVINFTDEEGQVLGEFGSMAITGELTKEKLHSPRGGVARLRDGMERLEITEESALNAIRPQERFIGYLEVHIEQGKRLEENGIDIGVVSSIVGNRSARLIFTGQAAHAGTTPMAQRRDALWGCVEFVNQGRQLVMEQFTPGVFNVGSIDIKPNAFNIVPGKATLNLEFRHGTEAILDQMQAGLYGLAQESASKYGLELEIVPADVIRAAPSAEIMMSAIEQGATRLDLKHRRMLSFAGHDTQTMAPYIPSAMYFVPSVDGISHNPKEYTHPQDCVNAGDVMLNTVLVLAGVA